MTLRGKVDGVKGRERKKGEGCPKHNNTKQCLENTHTVVNVIYSQENKKSELMLMRRATASV